jgi:hypothetical protein
VAKLIASFVFLPSFCGPHTGLSHHDQRPKTVEATIHPSAILQAAYAPILNSA